MIEGRLLPQREEIRFFSTAASHRQVLTKEIKAVLQEVKKSWKLSNAALPLHCILSSDFALVRMASFKKPSRFVPTATLVQRDAQQFLPLSLEQVSLAYQKISNIKLDGSKTIAYAAIRTDFLEAITRAIEEAGFSIQKISLLPLSLYDSLPCSKKILLMDLSEQMASCFLFSNENKLSSAGFFPLVHFSNTAYEKEANLPLLLMAYLKREIQSLSDSNNFPELYWIIKTHGTKKHMPSVSEFLQREFSISLTEIDPCLLLNINLDTKKSFIKTLINRRQLSFLGHQVKNALTPTKKTLWERLLKIRSYHITSIKKFTAPSISQGQKKQQIIFFIYSLLFLILLFSPLSLLHDYFENKEIAKETVSASIRLKEIQLELNQLRRDAETLTTADNAEKELKELQVSHDTWPLLISELQKCAPPRGIWITQLTPVIKETKGNKPLNEISSIEIKGLYLEKMHGEELVHEYIDKLIQSPLFLSPKKESFTFSCSKEDGTAYAYPFKVQLPFYSLIR